MSKIQVDTERILDASKEIVDVSIRVKEIKEKKRELFVIITNRLFNVGTVY